MVVVGGGGQGGGDVGGGRVSPLRFFTDHVISCPDWANILSVSAHATGRADSGQHTHTHTSQAVFARLLVSGVFHSRRGAGRLNVRHRTGRLNVRHRTGRLNVRHVPDGKAVRETRTGRGG